MDLILRNARLADGSRDMTDIGIENGRIVAIRPDLPSARETIELGGRLVSSGFVETHIHLDKSGILDRCTSDRGDLEEAIGEVAKAKAAFTPDDVCKRASRTLEKAILQGTTHMRTHLEVDPVIGLRGLEGVLPLIKEYAWAIDLEICVFPQEGLLNNPGTDELMVAASQRRRAAWSAPRPTPTPIRPARSTASSRWRASSTSTSTCISISARPPRAWTWITSAAAPMSTTMAAASPSAMSPSYAALPMDTFEAMAKRLADAGVALTVLPSTDLYLMGRHHKHDHNSTRGVVPAHKLLPHGVNCSLSTNNVLNPFTPFGDCSLMRMANLYANIAQVGKRADMRGMLRHDHAAAGAADAAQGLWIGGGQLRRSGGARRHRAGDGGRRACARALRLQARAQDFHPRAGGAAPAALTSSLTGLTP